jgi:hypothetical protein
MSNTGFSHVYKSHNSIQVSHFFDQNGEGVQLAERVFIIHSGNSLLARKLL